MVRMKCEFEGVKTVEVGTLVPGKVYTNQGDISEVGERIAENADRTPIGGKIEILGDAKVFKVIELEGLEIRGRRGISEVLAGNLLASVVTDFEMKSTPEWDVGGYEIKYCGELIPAQGDARDVVLGGYGVDDDVEASGGAGCGTEEVGGSTGNVGRLTETKGGPEGGCVEGDVAPFVADVGSSELKEGGGHCTVVLVWLEEEGGEAVRVVGVSAEDEDTGEELNGQRVHALGREGRHGSCRNLIVD